MKKLSNGAFVFEAESKEKLCVVKDATQGDEELVCLCMPKGSISLSKNETENLIETLVEMVGKSAILVNYPPHLIKEVEVTIGDGSGNKKHLLKIK